MLVYREEKVIDVSDWDFLVESVYGKPYNFQQQDGCQGRESVRISIPEEGYDYENDTLPETVNHEEMGVSFKAWLERDPNQKLSDNEYDLPSSVRLWWYRNFYPAIQMVANDLYNRGLIVKGDYVIDIDW